MHTKHQKRKLRRFLALKEVFMLSLVAISITLMLLGIFYELDHWQRVAIDFYEICVGVFFISEFVFEWYHAKDRAHYFKYYWFYLLAAIPLPIESVELLRGIRALRLIKLLKIFSHLQYEHNTHLFSGRKRPRRAA